MSANAEEVVAEILRLVAGRGETVVGLATSGPVRFDYWACGLWSVERDLRETLGDVAVGLWLRHALDRYLDRETAETVVSSQIYRAVEESLEELGTGGSPHMKYEELHFKLVELRLRGVYGRRAVYKLKPFRCDVKVLAVRVYVPMWSLCPRGERETCEKRAELAERLRNRGVQIEDVTRGVYVPIDASELESLIRRVL